MESTSGGSRVKPPRGPVVDRPFSPRRAPRPGAWLNHSAGVPRRHAGQTPSCGPRLVPPTTTVRMPEPFGLLPSRASEQPVFVLTAVRVPPLACSALRP